MSDSFAVGDRVWYVLNGLGISVPPLWIAAVVTSVTATHVGIRTASANRQRYVSPARLTTDVPPAGVKTIVFSPGLVTLSRE